MVKEKAIKFLIKKLNIQYIPYVNILNSFDFEEDIPIEYIDLIITEYHQGKLHMLSGDLFIGHLKIICHVNNINMI